MKHIDDYEMIDKDIESSMRFARECFAAEEIANDTSRDLLDRIRASAELQYKQGKARAEVM
ncbi:hypothetical protein RE628_11295 [Paenibacillus sp. D2_2]|uniref:hypothetical protein n=1 Tax=Paenibacillus sp. D2_2 TaxID=3073092 RepID=UPI002815DF80|nr:hypothetical protein [Paenibacillus sp. D2_2]WMT42812.1 hypothetical protein RE628_11295 [Paenibacillus sp. D2_2]